EIEGVQVCESPGLHTSQHSPKHIPSPMSIIPPPSPKPPPPSNPQIFMVY
uniref:Uncharacterized protein n=1 Tax=Mustela putorius furo TaxID=9669 RepID=M3XP42_MUSPF